MVRHSFMEQNSLHVHRDMKQLRKLMLHYGSFTDKGLRMLERLTALRSLSLQHCRNITDEGLKAVVVPLSQQSLAQVDVAGCNRLTPLSSVGTGRALAHYEYMQCDAQRQQSASLYSAEDLFSTHQ